jgi:hypothetical protein
MSIIRKVRSELFNQKSRRDNHVGRRPVLRPKKLRFESLEDRRMLATIWVDPYVAPSPATKTTPAIYSTINDAVAGAKSGDTIKVMPGVYQSAADIDVNKTLTIIGGRYA